LHFTQSLGRILIVITAVLSVCAVGQQARAEQISYITSGTGSGTLGATQFTNQPFTVTIVADTADVQTVVSGLSVGVDNQSVQVQVGATTAIGPVNGSSYGLASTVNTAGFGYSELSLAQAFDIDTFNFAVEITSISSYDLVSFIGPVSTPQQPGQFFGVPTNLGFFNLTSTSGVTFQAIPEPSAMLIWPLVVCRLVTRRWQRRSGP
jgi:hypothetical protein